MCVRELRRRDGRWNVFIATESPDMGTDSIGITAGKNIVALTY